MAIPERPAVDRDTPPERNSTGRGLLQSPSALVIRATCFKMAEKTALLVLWSYCDAAGWCWPTLPGLAKAMGCDVKTARAAVTSLVQKGVILTFPHPPESNDYRIIPEQVTAFIEAQPTESGRAEGESPTNSGGTENGSPTESGTPRPTEDGMAALPNPVGKGKAVKVSAEKEIAEGTPSSVPFVPTSLQEPSTDAAAKPKRAKAEKPAGTPEERRTLGTAALADLEFLAELKSDHPGLRFDYECRRWLDHIETNPPKGNYKNGFRNWLDIAEKIRAREEARAGPYRNGTGPAPPAAPPQAFTFRTPQGGKLGASP